MTFLLTFLTSPLGRYVMLGVAVLAILGGLYAAGSHHGADSIRKQDQAAQAVAKADIATHEATAAGISQKAGADLARAHSDNQVRTITLIRRIPEYVTAEDDVDCRIVPGFKRLWDAGSEAGNGSGVSSLAGVGFESAAPQASTPAGSR